MCSCRRDRCSRSIAWCSERRAPATVRRERPYRPTHAPSLRGVLGELLCQAGLLTQSPPESTAEPCRLLGRRRNVGCSVCHCNVMLQLGLTTRRLLHRYRDLDRRDFQRIEHLLRKVRIKLLDALPLA